MHLISFIAIGIIAGIAGGFFGIGGAIILIPLLTGLFHFSQHLAQGTTLVALLFPIGLLAAMKYWQQGHVHWSAAIGIAIGFFFGGYGGATLAHYVHGPTLRRAFGALLVAMGLKILLGK
ncbi:MAG: sulfite exporter TauE/SafE family protein [Deltaproteobacteria bacterium]|nr:sulfite exporter TauE/SafE family protein [Deltaproteobacteria bacterium]